MALPVRPARVSKSREAEEAFDIGFGGEVFAGGLAGDFPWLDCRR